MQIPILDFDPNPHAVIDPFEGDDFKFPTKMLFPFLTTEEVLDFAEAHNAEVIGKIETITYTLPVYQFKINEEYIGLCQAPIGSAGATQVLDFLIAYGAKQIISAGSCGTLEDIPEGALILPTEALRDEGTSYHYVEAAPTIELNKKMMNLIQNSISDSGRMVVKTKTWTTDGFFRETQRKVKEYRLKGFGVVEMECAALTACAEFRGVEFGQFFFTADSLENIDEHNRRGWGLDSHQIAIDLGLKCLLNIPTE